MDKPTSEILSLIQNYLLSFLRRIWERGQAEDHIYTIWLLIFILSICDRIIGQADRKCVRQSVFDQISQHVIVEKFSLNPNTIRKVHNC